MKNIINSCLLAFAISSLFVSCNKEEQSKPSLCEVSFNVTLTDEIGRVYFYNNLETHEKFYYIGNPDTLKYGGGYVPCNSLLTDLMPDVDIGSLVVYSGMLKMYHKAEEPLYFGIELTEIKKVD